jgi:large subunit ribosomal protein L10
MPSQRKQNLLQSIVDFIDQNNNFTLVKFENTTHTQLENLRRHLKKSGAQFKVVKNTIFETALNKLATKNKKVAEFKQKSAPIKDNTALLGLGKDWSKALNAFHQFTEKEKTLTFKFGLLDNEIYPGEIILRIAKLPTKEQLIANITGSLKSPISKIVYSMKFNMNKLVYILNQKAKKVS